MKTAPAKVVRVQRIGATKFGNPTMNVELRFQDGETRVLRMENNSGLVYAIDNPEFRDRSHVFELTRAGRIRGFDRSFAGGVF